MRIERIVSGVPNVVCRKSRKPDVTVTDGNQLRDLEMADACLLEAIPQEQCLSLRGIEWALEFISQGTETRREDRVLLVGLARELNALPPLRPAEIRIYVGD